MHKDDAVRCKKSFNKYNVKPSCFMLMPLIKKFLNKAEDNQDVAILKEMSW